MNGKISLRDTLKFRVSYLLCENKTENDACGECDSCSKTKSFVHPDVHFSFPIINSDGTKLSDEFI